MDGSWMHGDRSVDQLAAAVGEERDDVVRDGAELPERLLPGRQLRRVLPGPLPPEQRLAHLRVLGGGAHVHVREVIVLRRDRLPGGAQRVAGLPVLGGAGPEQRLHGGVGGGGRGRLRVRRRGGAVGQSGGRGGAAGGVGGGGRDGDRGEAAHVGRGAGRVGPQRGHAQVVVGRGVAGGAHQRRRRGGCRGGGGRRRFRRRRRRVLGPVAGVAVVRGRAGAGGEGGEREEGQQEEHHGLVGHGRHC
ncbi:hypothetical protein C2845_PM13G00560 [Panicum miliaceum]|uniref:Uncharacterized protein n=1 Tax=Panicum miliaceum TaxID=4540 RepID=A0A3L6RN31_PANMI|nr:hypothetical protein C2845_PM13G00560 [Panicum miliaceum]